LTLMVSRVPSAPITSIRPRPMSRSPPANQKSGTVSVFHVDGKSGDLRLAGEPFASPVAVCALPL